MIQLVTNVDDAVATAIDRLVESGQFSSRSDLVRSGIFALLEHERRAAAGAQILAGYDQVPERAGELVQAQAAATAMIAEEPWYLVDREHLS